MELFAIVGKIHQINVAIGREHDEVAKILSIFISLWGAGRLQGEDVRNSRYLEALTRTSFITPSSQIIPVKFVFFELCICSVAVRAFVCALAHMFLSACLQKVVAYSPSD